MKKHLFIFTPGEWIGHGIITLTGVKEEINFITKWSISECREGIIRAEQQVEKQGLEEALVNHFQFSEIKDNQFKVTLENDVIGKAIYGQGKIDDTSIIWAFKDVGDLAEVGLAGAEMYTRQSQDDYQLHAEYYLDENHKTKIEGHLWRKNT